MTSTYPGPHQPWNKLLPPSVMPLTYPPITNSFIQLSICSYIHLFIVIHLAANYLSSSEIRLGSWEITIWATGAPPFRCTPPFRCRSWGGGAGAWRRKWQPTPVLLPGDSHGQISPLGCSPWGWPESAMTEWLSKQTGGPTLHNPDEQFLEMHGLPEHNQSQGGVLITLSPHGRDVRKEDDWGDH